MWAEMLSCGNDSECKNESVRRAIFAQTIVVAAVVADALSKSIRIRSRNISGIVTTTWLAAKENKYTIFNA